MNLVAGAVQEAGVDEGHAPPGRRDAVGQVDAGAPLLVHDAHLDRQRRQAQHGLHRAEDGVGEGDLLRAMHLGPNDVDGAGEAVTLVRRTLQVVQADQAGHGDVDQAFGNLPPLPVQHRVGRQVQADVADHQQAAPLQRVGRAVRRGIGPVAVHAPLHGLAVLDEARRQVAAHQAQPVGIDQPLVLGIHRRNAVLGVGDDRQGRLDHHVSDARRIGTADAVIAVDDDLQMQAVVAQQDARGRRRLARIADEDRRIGQTRRSSTGQADDQPPVLDTVFSRLGMATLSQRRRLIQQGAGAGDDPAPTLGVIAAALGRFAQSIRAIEGVIQTAPARIGGVQQIAGVGQGHDQLRPGHAGDLGIDIGGFGARVRPFGLDVADLAQEGLIGLRVRLARVGAVPVVQLRLQIIPPRQQGAVLRRMIRQHPLDPGPEGVGRHARAGRGFVADEGVQFSGDAQASVTDIDG